MPREPIPRLDLHSGSDWVDRSIATRRGGQYRHPIRHDRQRSGRAFRHLANLTGLAAIIYRRLDGRAVDVIYPEDLGGG